MKNSATSRGDISERQLEADSGTIATSGETVMLPSAADDSQRDHMNLIIRASAGTGKTFQLSNRYLKLVLSGNAPERILATTFTRKAAGEILDRIMLRLAEATLKEDGATKLAEELKMPGLTCERCRQVLRQLTMEMHRLRISTLDSFFLQITQSLSLELGLPPAWQILDSTDNRRLQEEALASLLDESDDSDVASISQWLAKGDVKRDVYQLLFDTVAGMYDLYLETPASAWKKIRRKTILDSDQLQKALADLEGFQFTAGKQLTKGFDQSRQAALQSDWETLVEKGIGASIASGRFTYYRAPLPEEMVRVLEPIVVHGVASIVNRVAMQNEATHDLLDRFHKFYESQKLDRRALQFSDLALYLVRSMEGAVWNQLAFRLDGTIDSLLLDEFQDTSLHQWSVIRPFARHATASVAGRSFLCVGDGKQAIYGWRGGNADLINALRSDLQAEMGQTDLDESWRSAEPIVEVVNQIHYGMIKHPKLDDATTAVATWSRDFPEHKTARKGLPGWVTLETSAAASTDKAEDKRAMVMTLAAQRVQELHERAPWLSIAVLVRKNVAVGQAIYELQRLGVPASEEGGTRLVDAAAVQLVISRLSLAEHPYDTASRYHLSQSPWAKALGLHRYRDDAAAERLASQTLEQLANVGFGAAMAAWAEQLGPYVNDRERRRLRQLVELGDAYQLTLEKPRTIGCLRQIREPLGTARFIERIQEQLVREPSADLIRVMTIHQSKGLQFDVVILPELDDKWPSTHPTCVTMRERPTEPIEAVCRYVKKEFRSLFPDVIQKTFESHARHQMQEDLCVLYVALTRAVHCLQMIVAPDEVQDTAESEAEERAEDPSMTDDSNVEVTTTRKRKKSSSSDDKSSSTLILNSAGLIRAALVGTEPLPASKVVFHHGDKDWIERVEAERSDNRREDGQGIAMPNDCGLPIPNHPTATARKPIETNQMTGRRLMRRVRKRAIETVTPSSLEGNQVKQASRLRDRFPAIQDGARQRGELVHDYFEHIGWLEDGLPSLDDWRTRAQASQTDEEQIRLSRKLIETSLAYPSVQRLLSKQYYLAQLQTLRLSVEGEFHLEIRCEQPLLALHEKGYLSGSIDRLVIAMRNGRPYAADIVDYKTDVVPNADIKRQRTEYYRPQLDAYARGLQGMLRILPQRITTRLVFLTTGDVVTLSESDQW